MIDPKCSNSVETNNTPSILKDFGTVICGQKHYDSIEIRNNKNVPVVMTVAEEESTRNYSNALNLRPKEINVKPGQTAVFKLTLISHEPGVNYIKKYTISVGSEIISNLVVHSKSLGPSIKSKKLCFDFYLLRNATITTKRLEMSNESKCPTKFQFEEMGNNCPFQVSEKSGLIKEGSTAILNIQFTPTKPGIYHKRLYCLFQYHKPLLVVLTGIYYPRQNGDVKKLRINKLPEDADHSFESYMENLNQMTETDLQGQCAILISPSNKKTVKFAESIEAEECEDLYRSTEEIHSFEDNFLSSVKKNSRDAILTNYYLNAGNNLDPIQGLKLINVSQSKRFKFQWNDDNLKNFRVIPKSGNLDQYQQVNFYVEFTPEFPDRLYNGNLDLEILPFSENKKEDSMEAVLLPTTLTLNLIGHSFSNDSSVWLNQCEIVPKEVILPSTVPGQVVYSTFIIKRSGHLPVTFQFVPPKHTCVKIKPPLGHISDLFQIFVVQFDATGKREGIYTEKWCVAYNGNSKSSGEIHIRGQVEIPKIIVGLNNSYRFETILPYDVCIEKVPIHNPTGLNLCFELFVSNHIDWIDIPAPCGELEPLSDGFVEIIFKPVETKEYMACICCVTRSVKMQSYVTSTAIELQGSCQDGFLVSTPTYHDFGSCLYGVETLSSFHIFNFTPAMMNFKLSVVNDIPFEETSKNVISVEPHKGSVSGKSNINVEIRIIPYYVELTNYKILCQLMTSEGVDPLPYHEPRTLFTFRIDCVIPTFKILDLDVEGSGPLISPDWLWTMMNINGLNKALQTILPGDEKCIRMKLPEAAVGSTPIIVHLLIETRNLHKMTWEIKKKFSYHRPGQSSFMADAENEDFNYLTLAPLTGFLEPRCRDVLKMIISFVTAGRTIYEWSVTLPQNRIINIRTSVNALVPDEQPQTSMYLEPEFHMKPIFIGDINPPVQFFWLYNNSALPTSYSLDRASLEETDLYLTQIFDCLNPNGIIPPFSTLPLMFTFQPIELKSYSVTVILRLNPDDFICLTLIGNGILNYSNYHEFFYENTLPEKPILRPSCVPVELSMKICCFEPILTFSNAQKIFYLKNTSQDKVWGFHWHIFQVESVMRAHVEPNNGTIKPGEMLLVRLIVESFSHPAIISFSIPCDLVDYSALQDYKNASYLKEKTFQNYQDYFTITEQGITYEIPKVEIPEKPKMYHTYIAVKLNITSAISVESKLTQTQQQQLLCAKQLEKVECNENILDDKNKNVVNETLEKIIWQILNSSKFERKLMNYKDKFGHTTYPQILAISEKEQKEDFEEDQVLSNSLEMHTMQKVLENTILDILFLLEESRLCRLKPDDKEAYVSLGKYKDSSKIVTQKIYFASWTGRYNFKCSFSVSAPEHYGIYAVFQALNFRKNVTCRDYVHFKVPRTFYSKLLKERKHEKVFCGKIYAAQTHWSQLNDSARNRYDISPVADNSFVAPGGYMQVTINVAQERLLKDEKLELKIAFTSYKQDCNERQYHIQCRKCEWIWEGLVGDNVQNCPYTSCLDENNCKDLESPFEIHEIVSNETGTKVTVVAVSAIMMTLFIFAICLCSFRRSQRCCWKLPANNSDRVEMNRTRPNSGEQFVTTFHESPTDTVTPSAPALNDEKDVPPSYESLFPSK